MAVTDAPWSVADAYALPADAVLERLEATSAGLVWWSSLGIDGWLFAAAGVVVFVLAEAAQAAAR